MLPEPGLTIGQLQLEARQRLVAGGIETAALDARLIIQHALGLSHETLIGEPGRLVGEAQCDAVDICLKRRLDHEPVSRIIGEREFYGRGFAVTRDVLDPRADTETLIDQVLDIAKVLGPGLRIADVGTGSGAIIVTLLAELPAAIGTATDISEPALAVAQHNAVRLAVSERINFVQTAWLEAVSGPYDVIVSNPPYIESDAIDLLSPEVTRFDPPVALDGGDDGLNAYRAIIPQAVQCLISGGYLCFEIGAGQANAVLELMAAGGFPDSGAVSARRTDLGDHVRVVTGQKP